MASDQKKTGTVERRDFLKAVGLAGTAAAVAVPLAVTGAEAEESGRSGSSPAIRKPSM